jgi:hypothetical protein
MKSTGAVDSTKYRSSARGEGLEHSLIEFPQMGDAGLQQLRAAFEAEREALAAELAQVRRKIQLRERVLYHPRLHPGQRQTCLHVMMLIETAQAKGEELPIGIKTREVAKITCQSRETVGKHILELTDLGIFSRHEEKPVNFAAKRPNSYIFVSPGPLYHRLDEIGGQRTWGGLRERKIRQVEDTSTSAVCATQDPLPLDTKSQQGDRHQARGSSRVSDNGV